MLLDLAEYSENGVNFGKRLHKTIDKCPDKDAYLEFSIRSVALNLADDITSHLSGIDDLSCGSDPESNFNFDLMSQASRKKKHTMLRDGPMMPSMSKQLLSSIQPKPSKL